MLTSRRFPGGLSFTGKREGSGLIPPRCLSITGLHRKPHCSTVRVLAVLTDSSQPQPCERVSEFPLSVPPSSSLSMKAKGLMSLDYIKGSSSCEPARVAPAVSALTPTQPCILSCRGDLIHKTIVQIGMEHGWGDSCFPAALSESYSHRGWSYTDCLG